MRVHIRQSFLYSNTTQIAPAHLAFEEVYVPQLIVVLHMRWSDVVAMARQENLALLISCGLQACLPGGTFTGEKGASVGFAIRC
jgi:hypothetical protein